MTFWRVAILLIGLTALASAAGAATWYASPSGTGDGTAEGTPMAWSSVSSLTSSGDTIRIVDMDSTISKPESLWVSNRNYETKRFSWYDQISMTMDDYEPISRSATGEFFVQGPISMVSSDPAWDGTKNGIQIMDGVQHEGLDSRSAYYSAAYNVADDMLSSPVAVSAGSSVVLAVGVDSLATVYLKTAAVLTVVSELPPGGSFRWPYVPYSGRAIDYNISEIDISFLPSHTFSGQRTVHVASYSNWSNFGDTVESVERIVERVHLDHMGGWHTTRINQAVQNAKDYPADECEFLAEVLLALCSDQRTDVLVYRAIQYGLDYIGIRKAGGPWSPEEGFSAFRTAIMLFTARALGDETLEAWVLADAVEHGPYKQCYYVAESQIYSQPYNLAHSGSTFIYTTGTVTVENGSTTVQGSGSNWPASLPNENDWGLDVFYFGVVGDSMAYDPFGKVYVVESWTDADTIVLTEPYTGASGGGKSFKLGDMVWYGHGKPSKMETYGVYYDYGEYVSSMIGLPDWSGQHATEYLYNEGPNLGNPTGLTDTYRHVANGGHVGTMLALYLMGLSDEYVAACGDRRVLDYLDRWIEYNEDMLAKGEWSAANRSTWIYPAWAITYWNQYRPGYGNVWSAKPTAPSPADDATSVATTASLSWTEKTGTYGVKLYLGTSSPLGEEDLVGVVTAESYDPDLQPNTTYYWRTDYYDTGQTQVKGTEWSFSTGSAYYTSPTGTGDGLSISSPRAWNSGSWVTAGDHVYLLDGNYGGWTVPVSGSSGSVITFEAVNPLRAVFSNINIPSRSYVTLDGLQVDTTASPGYGVWFDTSSHVTLQDSLVHGDPEDDYSPTQYGVFIDDSSYVTVTRCEIAHLYNCRVSGSGCMGVQVNGTDALCHDNTVSHCYVHDVSGSFLRTGSNGANIVFAYNRLSRQCRFRDPDPHGTGLSIHDDDITCLGNIIYDVGESWPISVYHSAQNTEAAGGYQRVVFENNLVFDTEDRHTPSNYYEYLLNPIYFVDVGTPFVVRSNSFLNGVSTGASSGAQIWQWPYGTYSGMTFHANLVRGSICITEDYYQANKTSLTKGELDDLLATLTQDDNWSRYGWASTGCGYYCYWSSEELDTIWPGTDSGSRTGITGISATPGSVFNVTNGEWPYAFTIAADSIVAGTADPATTSTTDILGNSRGDTPSPGVYEPETVALLPPNCIYGTTPLRGATAVAANQTISWTAPLRASTYNVYVGTTWPPALRSAGQAGTSYSTASLNLPAETKIYWRVESVGANGTTMSDEYWYTTSDGSTPSGSTKYCLIRR